MVSFERVFEIIDLPQDIIEKENAIVLQDVKGELEFDNVTFNYRVDESILLKDVKRYGRMEDVGAVLSLSKPIKDDEQKTKAAGKNGQSSKLHRQDEEIDSDSGETESTSQAREVALEGVSFTARPGQSGRAGRSLRRGQDHDDLSHPALV